MFCFIPLVLSLLVLLPGSSVASGGTQSFTALKFADDVNSYISFSPDMSPFSDQFSVCMWVKKLSSSIYSTPFAYSDQELSMTDSGYHNRLFGSRSWDGALTSKFTVPRGTWFSLCRTWSYSSRTFSIYLNGVLVGTQTTASGRRLRTGGRLMLGNRIPRAGNQFGGELYNLNMFNKELSSTEVATVSVSGLCGSIPENLEAYRSLKWENILKQSRTGTVQDIVVSTCFLELQSKLDEVQNRVQELEEQCNSTREELAGVKRELNKSEVDLNETQAELEVTKEELSRSEVDLNETQAELSVTKEELSRSEVVLNETQAELVITKEELRNLSLSKCALTKGNLTKWDMLYGPSFYNQILTRDLYTQLRDSWNTISEKLFGMKMTDQVIELVKDLKSVDLIDNCRELS